MTTVLLVDDHTILRQGVASLLRSAPDLNVIAEARTGAEAVQRATDLQPDLIVMDMSLPDIDGIEAGRRIRQAGCASEIIFLTMHNDPGLVEAAFEIGARGYLLKDDTMDDLLYAVRAVLRGERFTSVSLTTGETRGARPSSTELSRREREVVSLIAAGLTSKEIASRLSISVKTVETHRARIMQKLGVRKSADVIRYALTAGLAPPEC